MSDKLHETAKRLPFSLEIDAEQLSRVISQNYHQLENKTGGDDYIPLSAVPYLLGIQAPDLVFLLVCRFVPAPELFDEGLFFYRSTFLAALRKFAGAASPAGYLTFSARGALGAPLYREWGA